MEADKRYLGVVATQHSTRLPAPEAVGYGGQGVPKLLEAISE